MQRSSININITYFHQIKIFIQANNSEYMFCKINKQYFNSQLMIVGCFMYIFPKHQSCRTE